MELRLAMFIQMPRWRLLPRVLSGAGVLCCETMRSSAYHCLVCEITCMFWHSLASPSREQCGFSHASETSLTTFRVFVGTWPLHLFDGCLARRFQVEGKSFLVLAVVSEFDIHNLSVQVRLLQLSAFVAFVVSEVYWWQLVREISFTT